MVEGQSKLIVGLGNPGPRYHKTRHNLGWVAIDAFAAEKKLSWKNDKDCELADFSFNSNKIFLIKPTTFMNRSGEPVQRIAHFYKVAPEHILVIHDELDLILGSVRLKRGGGEGGHNGLRSISTSLGSREYMRLRIGVGRPLDKTTEDDVVNWLLSPYSSVDEKEFDIAVSHAISALWCVLEHSLEYAQNKFNN